MRIVTENNLRLFDQSSSLYENLLVGIHHDVADTVVLQQWFERAQPKHFIKHFLRKTIPLRCTQRYVLLIDELQDNRHKPGATGHALSLQ